MKLELEDIRSVTWRKVKAHADEQLAMLRADLEKDLSPEKTATIRGRIRELNLLLALEIPAPVIVAEDE